MATSGSWNIEWASTTWGGYPKGYRWTGNWNKSGNTITLSNMTLQIYMISGSGWGTGTDSVTVTGGGAQTVSWNMSGSASNVASLGNTSFGVGGTDTSATIQCVIAAEVTGSTTISFDATVTPPTGLGINNISTTDTSVSANVYVSGWGGAGDANSRYRNLSVMRTNYKPDEQRRYQRVYGNETSGIITVTSNTQYGTGTIDPNTRYWLWWYATNGTYGTEAPTTSTTEVVTKASAPTVGLADTTATSATISYSTTADGGYYAKNIQYSLDNGSTWVTGATVTGGAATTGSFTISGLTPGTVYTVQTRVNTTAGNTTGTSVSFATEVERAPMGLYGPVNSQATRVSEFYGPVNGEAKLANKVYGSVNGQAKIIHQGFGHAEYYRYGRVVYYTDSNHTTTRTINLESQSDINGLCAQSVWNTTWDASVQGFSIPNTNIKEVYLTSLVNSIPNNFLYYCTSLDNLDFSQTTITTTNPYFVYGCSTLNVPITLPQTLTTIQGTFFSENASFNQPITLPSGLVSIGYNFFTGNNSMTSPINVGSLSESIILEDTYSSHSFNVSSSSAAYANGIPIAGSNRAAWIARFPNLSGTWYRKLIDGGY